MNRWPLLSILTLLPVLGAILLTGVDRRNTRLARGLGLGFSFVLLGLALVLWQGFDRSDPTLQFVERHEWIPSLGVQYFVGVDGLGLLLVMLTALVGTFALLASRGIAENARLYYSLFLLLQSGLIGTFTALNFFHWFIYWELSLVPAFFLIKLWGGPQRSRAATQFFIYTLVGSVAMLLAFQAIYLATGTFDLIQLAEWGRTGRLAPALVTHVGWLNLKPSVLVMLVFGGVFLGFAVKVPLVPFHIWLPSAYAEAPTGVSMVLTGVMSKMGVYGFLRILLPLFPQQTRWILGPLLVISVVTIVYAAWTALAQRDLKKIIAYSSINHLGYCLLGMFAAMRVTGTGPAWAAEKAAAMDGVLLQMFNHGVTASALFCCVGLLEARSGGWRGLDDFGGLRRGMPVFCGCMGIALFSSLGLPGLNGFVGEFLVFKGSFPLAPWAVVIAVLGLFLTALFLLNILQRVFSGPLNTRWQGMADLSRGERLLIAPAIALMFCLGLYPAVVLDLINPTVLQWVAHCSY